MKKAIVLLSLLMLFVLTSCSVSQQKEPTNSSEYTKTFKMAEKMN